VGAASAQAVARPRCKVTAERAVLLGLVVHVGAEQFTLDLDDARVDVWLREGASDARVEVLSPLQFSTSHSVAEIPLRVAREVDLFEGSLRLGRGARPQIRHARDDRVEVGFDQSLALRVEPEPRLSCADLTLASRGESRHSRAWRQWPDGARFVGVGPGLVRVAPTQTAPPMLSVEYAGPLEWVEERAGRVRVRARWEKGSLLDGWVPADRVRSEYERPRFLTDGYSAGAGCQDVTPERVHVQRGVAVASRPNGPVWARFATDTDAQTKPELQVDGWVPVTSVDGIRLDSCSEHAWVPSSDVVPVGER
jgi:hypothetical protein